MAYGLSILAQESFGGGIFRGRRAPGNSVYDALNGLVDEEGNLFERGASVFKSTAASAALVGLADVQTLAGQRTMFWDAAASSRGYVLAADDVTPVEVMGVGTLSLPAPLSRVVGAAGLVFFLAKAVAISPGERSVWIYGGSRLDTFYTTGSLSVTEGGKSVTGVGTTWVGNVDPGTLLLAGDGLGVVASVNSNTSLTLVNPWSGASLTAGSAYQLSSVVQAVSQSFAGDPVAIATVGSPGRVLVAIGSRIYFSPAGWPYLPFAVSDYHEMPVAATIVGMDAIGTSAVVFTTEGVWAITNMDLDPFDAAGNIQQSVQQVSKDVILWGDPGIASWANTLLVPAVDDVYLFSLDGAPVPLSGSIRPLYRSYVKAGYQPGIGAVHRAHYFLPILNGTTLVDVLVCRLDLRDSTGAIAPAWTRWSGHAAGVAYAQRVGASTRQPRLLGLSGQRVTDLSDTLDTPSTGTDADGTVPTFEVVTRDLLTGGGARGQLVKKVRLDYELAGTTGPGVVAAVAEGAVDAAFTALSDPVASFGASDGTVPATWKVTRRAPAVRFRFRSTSANSKLIVRGVEMHVRPSGKA